MEQTQKDENQIKRDYKNTKNKINNTLKALVNIVFDRFKKS